MKKNKLPLILQSEMAECGLACLAMILGFYHCRLSLSDIRRSCKASLKGMTLYQLKKIAERMNLSAKILRINLNQLATLKFPCIIHWNLNHFLVVKERTKSHFIVHDPAQGMRTLTLCQLKRSFTGIALELFPTKKFVPIKAEKMQSSTLLLDSIKKHAFGLLKLIVMSCLIQLLYIAGIKLIQHCLDLSVVSHSTHVLFYVLIGFFGIKLMELCATAIRSIMITCVGNIMHHDFALTVMKHLLSLPNAFFDNRHVGDVLNRFAAIEKIRSTLTEGLVEGWVDGLVSILTLITLLIYSIKLAIIVFIAAFAYLLTRLHYQIRARQYQEESLYARSAELSHFMETVRGIPSIKLFSKEEDRLSHWTSKYIRSLNATSLINWYKSRYDALKQLFFGIDLTIVLLFGCLLLSDGQMTLGMFYAFLAYRQQFTMAVTRLIDNIQDYRLLKLHLDRLNDIVSEPPELIILAKDHTHPKPQCLSVENICFRYSPDEKIILHDVNFTIASGECVAITGPSGCGKTTLLKILMGLLPPSQGRLLMGEHSDQIAVYPQHVQCYRKSIAGVLQEDILFSGTIADNISFFAPNPDTARIYACAELAGVIDDIKSFPMGFNTLMGDMGSVLSGGQKQRILLARALYARPSILFLDEATSHLDSKKEYQVNQAIRSLGVTVVMIAHRKETIHMADRVIQL